MHRAEPAARSGQSNPRLKLIAVAAASLSLVIAGCGGASSSATGDKSGDGAKIFSDAGCAGCHTLAAAGSHGTTGPNLDGLKPSEATVANQVANGGGGMPSFKGALTQKQIDAVAKYVSTSAGRP